MPHMIVDGELVRQPDRGSGPEGVRASIYDLQLGLRADREIAERVQAENPGEVIYGRGFDLTEWVGASGHPIPELVTPERVLPEPEADDAVSPSVEVVVVGALSSTGSWPYWIGGIGAVLMVGAVVGVMRLSRRRAAHEQM